MSSARPIPLQAGGLPSVARRRGLAIVLLLAVLWRIAPLWRLLRDPSLLPQGTLDPGRVDALTRAGVELRAFLLDPDWSWVGAPLYDLVAAAEISLRTGGLLLLLVQAVLSLLLVTTCYRVGRRWMGEGTGLLAALLCALSEPVLRGGLRLLPALVASYLALTVASALARRIRLRDDVGGVGLGVGCGLLVVSGAPGCLWGLLALAALPISSRVFRGRGWLRTAGWVLLGGFAVLAPGLMRGALVQGDLVTPAANVPFELHEAAASREVFRPVGMRAFEDVGLRLEAARLGLGAQDPGHALGRQARWWGRWLDRLGEEPAAQLGLLPRRARAFFAPAPPEGEATSTGPRGLTFVAVTAFAWLGIFTLLGSLRAYLPLFGGVAIPLGVGLLQGVEPTLQLWAAPFLCLFAAYGLVRWWQGRHWWPTWLLAPAVLAWGAWVAGALG